MCDSIAQAPARRASDEAVDRPGCLSHLRLFIVAVCSASGLFAQTQIDSYLSGIARQHWEKRAAAIEAIRTPAQVRERQAYIREKMTASIGGFPSERTPLNARVTGVLQRDGYRVEKLVYESLPKFYVTANVYVPAGAGPFPAALGVAGHSANGKASSTYQHGWIAMAKRGILVLAFDPPGQGERSEHFDADLGRSRVGIGTGEHMMTGVQCLLAGSNYARYEIWDGRRGFDYLLTRGDVDAKRIAVAGNSGGGTQSAYLAVFEPRLALAAPSCYITSWENLWFKPGPQDAEQNFPGFISDGFDFGDFAISFAPRPLKIMTAIQDFFPIDGARKTYTEVRRIYEVMGAADRAGYFEYDDTHGWSKPRREATYQWMDKWLMEKSEYAGEPEFETMLDKTLEVTPTGQVATSFGGETVQSLNRAEAERLFARRSALGASEAKLRELVATRVGLALDSLGNARGGPRVTKQGESDGEGYRIERIAIETEKGIEISAVVLSPALRDGRKAAVLYLNPAGRQPDGDMAALARSGHVVLAPEARGFSETAASRGSSGYNASWQSSMRAMLVGKTVIGIQLTDVLRCFDYLTLRGDVDPARIAVFGKGNGGVLALYSAAMEPRFHKAASEGAVLSYMDIARARVHEGMASLIVPGVLKDFDLPDLARAVRPRTLWIVEPRTPTGARAALPQSDFTHAGYRPEGWSFEKVYAEWMKR